MYKSHNIIKQDKSFLIVKTFVTKYSPIVTLDIEQKDTKKLITYVSTTLFIKEVHYDRFILLYMVAIPKIP